MPPPKVSDCQKNCSEIRPQQLKSSLPSKWASKHLLGVTFILLVILYQLKDGDSLLNFGSLFSLPLWTAPPGCLQFFNETTGIVKSFNFKNVHPSERHGELL